VGSRVRLIKGNDSIYQLEHLFGRAALGDASSEPRHGSTGAANPQIPALLCPDEPKILGGSLRTLIGAAAYRNLELSGHGFAVIALVQDPAYADAVLLTSLAEISARTHAHTANFIPNDSTGRHTEIAPSRIDVLLPKPDQRNAFGAGELESLTLVTFCDVRDSPQYLGSNETAGQVWHDREAYAVALQHDALLTVGESGARRVCWMVGSGRIVVSHDPDLAQATTSSTQSTYANSRSTDDGHAGFDASRTIG
jgi:hypothetical protein